MLTRKNILYITSRSDMGGGPKHVYDLCSNIEGINTFIASPLSEPFGIKFKEISIDHFELPHRKFSFLIMIKLFFFCKKNKIDIIHSHGRGAGIYSRALGALGFKIIHTFHGVHAPKNIKERIIILVERLLYFFTNKFISVSGSEKNNAINLKLANPKDIIVIPNGIDLSLYEGIGSPSEGNILGTLSRLDPHKNNKEIISFMKMVGNYKLLIAGDGEQKEELEVYIKENQLTEKVMLLGEIQNIEDFLNSINIYVSSSKGEGLPYSILEALAAKKKIIASNVSGHKDLLSSKSLYNLGSIKEFKERLEDNTTTDKFDSKYTIEEMTKSLLQLYSTI